MPEANAKSTHFPLLSFQRVLVLLSANIIPNSEDCIAHLLEHPIVLEIYLRPVTLLLFTNSIGAKSVACNV